METQNERYLHLISCHPSLRTVLYVGVIGLGVIRCGYFTGRAWVRQTDTENEKGRECDGFVEGSTFANAGSRT